MVGRRNATTTGSRDLSKGEYPHSPLVEQFAGDAERLKFGHKAVSRAAEVDLALAGLMAPVCATQVRSSGPTARTREPGLLEFGCFRHQVLVKRA